VVYVDRQGRAYRTDHVLDEKAPGASLAVENARKIAETFLGQAGGTQVENHRLVDSNRSWQPHGPHLRSEQ
jgi:hypothetical protein